MSDLRTFKIHSQESGGAGKLYSALIVAFMVSAAAAYSFQEGLWNSSHARVIASRDVTAPAVPVPTPPATPATLPSTEPLIPGEQSSAPPATTVAPSRVTSRHHVVVRSATPAESVAPSPVVATPPIENPSSATAPAPNPFSPNLEQTPQSPPAPASAP